MIIFFNSFSF